MNDKTKSPKYCLFDFNAWRSSQDVLVMSWAQRGVYLELMAIAWGSASCSIPNDSKKIAAMLHMTEVEWLDSFAEAILPAWQEASDDPTRLVQPRLFSTWKEGIEASERLKNQGKAGAKSRGFNVENREEAPLKPGLSHTKAPLKPGLSNKHNITQHYEKPPVGPHADLADADPKKNDGGGENQLTPDPDLTQTERVVSERFGDFWSEYPNKVGKPKAEQSYRKAIAGGTEHGDIMQGLQRWKGSRQWTKDGGEFIPHPTTWLNQKRWADDPRPNHNTSGPTRPNEARRDAAPEEY